MTSMRSNSSGEAPETLPFDLSSYPKLDKNQAGHLRHFHNLVSQPNDHWRLFDTADGHDEFDDAKRYQLATMAYAAGAAHYHRLPALRGPFRRLMRQMIMKMLRKEVWSYWFLASHSGKIFDPDIKELRKPWADPVVKENIMYSGHLLLMTSLYAMLFDDEEFEKEGALTFRWDPLFWGMGPEEFVYDNKKLQEKILGQMEENEWVGVCCEPNAVFVICNQFPLIAMRYNDVRHGTNHVEGEILPKYKAALEKKGMLADDGLYASFFAVKQKRAIPARHGAHTAWANAFMHAWNSKYVEQSYDKQTLGFLTKFNSKTRLHPARIAMPFRRLVTHEGHDPHDPATLTKARAESRTIPPRFPYETLNWLGFTMMLSELGKRKELDDLLEYADEYLNPTWENGGLYYPRNGKILDKEWNLTHIEPHSGNSGIGYSRLNVTDGQKIMWERPWTRDVLEGRPWIDGDGFEDDIDFLRGVWDVEKRAMVLTVRKWRGEEKVAMFVLKNVEDETRWAIYVNGKLKDVREASQVGQIEFKELIGQEEVSFVVQQLV